MSNRKLISYIFVIVFIGPTLHDEGKIQSRVYMKAAVRRLSREKETEELDTVTELMTPKLAADHWVAASQIGLGDRVEALEDELGAAFASAEYNANHASFGLTLGSGMEVDYSMIQKVSKECARQCEGRADMLDDLYVMMVGVYTMMQQRRDNAKQSSPLILERKVPLPREDEYMTLEKEALQICLREVVQVLVLALFISVINALVYET